MKSKNSLFGCRPLMPNFQQMQVNSKDKPLTFDSEKAASDYAIQLIEKSKNYARKIANHNGDDDKLIDVESEVLDEIKLSSKAYIHVVGRYDNIFKHQVAIKVKKLFEEQDIKINLFNSIGWIEAVNK